jgi:3-deoxy-D-manno-octulosonic-acid transferase
MIDAAQQNHIPLFAANAQYPGKSYKRDRDRNSIRAKLPSGFAGILAKSETQAIKFQTVGATNITVTGEIRFDQPIPPKLMIAAKQFTAFEGRPVVTISSVVSGEDGTYINAIRAIIDRSPTAPVFIYVPRAPERFDESFDLLKAAGLRVAVRSKALGPDLTPIGETPWNEIDVLLGDSMGEMYFYLALCDIAITGGGFAGKGAHNVIEPLALLKPVIVGPEIRTIEYPAVEAIQAGVLSLVKHPEDLAEEIERLINNGPDDAEMLKKISAFYAEHSGGCAKTLAAVSKMLEANSS